jgi:hypothetical protein
MVAVPGARGAGWSMYQDVGWIFFGGDGWYVGTQEGVKGWIPCAGLLLLLLPYYFLLHYYYSNCTYIHNMYSVLHPVHNNQNPQGGLTGEHQCHPSTGCKCPCSPN